ncbi:hypothetical protein G6030_09530 [Dietzia sp. E1]|uniref:hypothetical protein n=1 Tax=Dietzia sp. E1 TaxID=328361 RepID=UPI0015FC8F3C|nr:hypothetical protein [Dietzia sp. E1]MBB1021522.1 hypothetical protein [Dietzia sp. E1]
MTEKRWYVRENIIGPDGVELGYWESRWVEFKRLFAQSWNNGYVKETVILCAVVWVVTVFGMAFLGWR